MSMLPKGLYRAIFLAAAGLMISSCAGTLDAVWSHTVTAKFGGNHQLALLSYYRDNTETIEISAFADVSGGTAGQVEITGARHLLCPGSFKAHSPTDLFTFFPSDRETHWQAIANLPQFATASGDPGGVTGPRGTYTVTVRVPTAGAHVATTFTAPAMSPGPLNLYYQPPECYPIADTPAQRRALLATYLTALVKLAGQTPSTLQSGFLGPITDAQNAVAMAESASDPLQATQGYEGAAHALSGLQDQVTLHSSALFPTVAARLGEATNDAIHLCRG